MNHLDKLNRAVKFRIQFAMIVIVAITAIVWIVSDLYFSLDSWLSLAVGVGTGLLLVVVAARILTSIVLEPLSAVWRAMLHVDPSHSNQPAPNLDTVRLGRELATSMALQIYQYASHEDSKEQIEHRRDISQAANIVSHMPLPLFVFNKQLLVTNASDAGITYCETDSASLFGHPIFDALNLEFPSEYTLEAWIQECQDNKVTHTGYWQRVRVMNGDGGYRQCDIAAFYNRDNQSGTEYIVTMFDHTEQYNQDDESMGFVALAVHELRTPLTMLRGYIELFQEEIGPKLDGELRNFMLKMEASADQLTGFVHNILNVTRIENNQLTVHLTEADWSKTIMQGARAMQLMASVRGKTIEYLIDDNLPSVAVDQITICEVINNLLDNAIKYSSEPTSKRIILKTSVNQQGLVETTVQDFGVGIPANVLPNLFEKFYRNHRTRAQIGGTGLGLYLCKAIIEAHGGQIWAKSKENEGATFGFTVLPFSKLAEEQKSGSGDIVRQANGWIKNHSYYRR